jgi:hypothetical protein
MTKKLNELKTEFTPTMTIEEIRAIPCDPAIVEKMRKMNTSEIKKFFNDSLDSLTVISNRMKARNDNANK